MQAKLHIVCPTCGAVNGVPQARLHEKPKCGQCHQPLFTGQPAEVDADSLQKHIQRNDIPVLVDFWAPWCGPCKAMAPEFSRAAEELEPRFRLLKLNTDSAQTLAASLNIRGIPTLILFRGGQEIARQAGAMQAAQIEQWAMQQLDSAA